MFAVKLIAIHGDNKAKIHHKIKNIMGREMQKRKITLEIAV